jgi:hypothetical protein
MSTVEMMTHLHIKHEYNLIECTLKHAHTSECLVLRHLSYEDDAKLELELGLILEADMPTVFVIDDRDKLLKGRAAEAIRSRAAKAAKRVSKKRTRAENSSPAAPPQPQPQPQPPQPAEFDHAAHLRATLDSFATAVPDRALTPEERRRLESEEIRVQNLEDWVDSRIALSLGLTLGKVGALKDFLASRGS